MRNVRSSSQFILIPNNGIQQHLQWRKLSGVKDNEKEYFCDTQTTGDMLSYSEKKSLVSSLHKLHIRHASSHHKLETEFKYKSNKKPYTSARSRQTQIDKIPEYVFSNHKRAQSRQVISSISIRSSRKLKQVSAYQLKQKIVDSAAMSRRVIGVVLMRRIGLRYKFSYCFLEHSKNMSMNEIRQNIIQSMIEFKSLKKVPYLFHMGGQPINDLSKDLNYRQYVIVADFSPKLNLTFEAKMQLLDEASKLQQKICNCQRLMGISPLILAKTRKYKSKSTKFQQHDNHDQQSEQDQDQQSYEWERIKDIKKYADELVQNPQKNQQRKSQKKLESKKNSQLKSWLNLKFEEKVAVEKNDKNPLFQTNCHYNDETLKSSLLIRVSRRLQKFNCTKNSHQIKIHFMDNLLQKVKKQNEYHQKPEKRAKPILNTKPTAKQFFKTLDVKNVKLSQQNIPYIVQKYGITRAEAHNLYAIYKTLEKISAMRMGKSRYSQIYEKGIDRGTFDEGMKDLQINPGQEVIRNICYFPDFISWEQFLKIISISLRKTPEEKLQAILQGIGGANNGQLTQLQIDVMVGSSLSKIFHNCEPQMKQYFVSVVMKQLDPNNEGKIQIQALKNRVLGKQSDDMDIVSFLMLNS